MVKVKILSCNGVTAQDTYGYSEAIYLGKGNFVNMQDELKEYYICKLPTGEIIKVLKEYGQLIINGDVGDLI